MIDPTKLRATDIMTEQVFVLPEVMSVPDAVAALRARGVTGAPVVSALGRCVGVFSRTDIIRRDMATRLRRSRRSSFFRFEPVTECFDAPEDAYVGLALDAVGDWMTRGVKAVRPETSVEEVCRFMLRERIHRVLVIDGKAVRGILSALDVVRFVAGGGVNRRRLRGRAGAKHGAKVHAKESKP